MTNTNTNTNTNNFNLWTCLYCMTANTYDNCIKCSKDKKLSIPPKLIRQTNKDNYKLDVDSQFLSTSYSHSDHPFVVFLNEL